MASYRNFPNEEDPRSLINENSSGQPADRTRNLFEDDVLETSSRGQDFLLKTGNYVGNEEINGTRTLQGGQNNNFGFGGRMSNAESSVQKGQDRWGSSFWKDCQPMHQVSDLGRGSKNGLDYKNNEGDDDNSSNDTNGLRESGKVETGQNDVPADEMLSADYYEQDGDDLSDSTPFTGFKKIWQSETNISI